MENTIEKLTEETFNEIVVDVEDHLFDTIREELIKNGNWLSVGEDNLGEMVNDVLRRLYFGD
jgi:hypothetical protein